MRRESQQITGLEQSVHAEATGHGASVDLTVPPLDGIGFHVLDRSVAGSAFDPLGGGPWSLRLTGSIDGTPLDQTFAVTFPSYPRVGAPRPAVARPSTGSATDLVAPLLLLAGGLLLAAITGLRRFRPRPAQPTPAR